MSIFTNSANFRHLNNSLIRKQNLSTTNWRSYPVSRFPKRPSGVGRTRPQLSTGRKILGHKETRLEGDYLRESFNAQPNTTPSNSLKRLLLQDNKLLIERQIEMLNVLVGFEQSNKYKISSESGDPLGYIVEEPKGFLGTLSRQAFATHRPFRAVVLDEAGLPILWVRRPFSWINSRMFVQRIKDDPGYASNTEPSPETFGEVQQTWHPWRRRYDIFLRENFVDGSLALSKGPNKRQSKETTYYQISKVDAGFLAWNFHVLDQRGHVIATINRAFRGIGREMFTDTGRYSVNFESPQPSLRSPLPNDVKTHFYHRSMLKELDLDTRALLLALAVNIDFDYFSRHSHTGSGGLFHMSSSE